MSNPDTHDIPQPDFGNNPRQGYAFSGKIMLSAIIILFFVVVLMVILHIYARWYLLRVRRRHLRNRRLRRRTATHLVFYIDPSTSVGPIGTTTRGLDPEVLKALPVFTYKTGKDEGMECAVCLCEFEDNETGRLLPKCNHSFHTECIDMWFHSHSTCPLCRAPVEVPAEPLPEPVSRSGSAETVMCVECRHEEGSSSLADSTPSSGGRSKSLDVRVEIPGRSVTGFEDESTSQGSGFRSPLSKVLSFGRILGRRSASCGGGASAAADEEEDMEVDVERGREGNSDEAGR